MKSRKMYFLNIILMAISVFADIISIGNLIEINEVDALYGSTIYASIVIILGLFIKNRIMLVIYLIFLMLNAAMYVMDFVIFFSMNLEDGIYENLALSAVLFVVFIILQITILVIGIKAFRKSSKKVRVNKKKCPNIATCINIINKKENKYITLNLNDDDGSPYEVYMVPKYYEKVNEDIYIAFEKYETKEFDSCIDFLFKCDLSKDVFEGGVDKEEGLGKEIYTRYRKKVGKPFELSNGMPLNFDENPNISNLLYTLDTKKYVYFTNDNNEDAYLKALGIEKYNDEMYLACKEKNIGLFICTLDFEKDTFDIVENDEIFDSIISKLNIDTENESNVEDAIAKKKKLRFYHIIALNIRKLFNDSDYNSSNKPSLILNSIICGLFLIASIALFVCYGVIDKDIRYLFIPLGFISLMISSSFLVYLSAQNPNEKLTKKVRHILKAIGIVLMSILFVVVQMTGGSMLLQLYSIAIFVTYLYGYLVICNKKSNGAYNLFAFTPLIGVLIVMIIIVIFLIVVVKMIISIFVDNYKSSGEKFNTVYTVYENGFERVLTYSRYYNGKYEYIDDLGSIWYTNDEPGTSEPSFYK